jgi:hypothetical protein
MADVLERRLQLAKLNMELNTGGKKSEELRLPGLPTYYYNAASEKRTPGYVCDTTPDGILRL